MYVVAWSFPIWYFLIVGLCESKYIFCLNPSFSPFNSFPMFLTNFWIFYYVLVVLIFCSKIVVFLSFDCWYVFMVSTPTYWLTFFSLFCNIWILSILFSCLDKFFVLFLSQIPSDLFSRVVFFVSFAVLLFSFHLNIYQRFSSVIFACCRRFLISVSSLISLPGFEFLFLFFMGTPILSQTNFAPALIKSFNSVMFSGDMFVNSFNFQLLLGLFSSLGFLPMVMKSSFQT